MAEGASSQELLMLDEGQTSGFADNGISGSIDLSRSYNNQGVIYNMAAETTAENKSLGQSYYEEVEGLKSNGISNAEAIRRVAEKYDKQENTVRTGIHQYRSRHINGNGSSPRPRGRRSSGATVDSYLASARQSLESALALVDQEVDDAKAALDAAQAHYDEVQANVKERKADIEKKLKAMA